MISKVSANAGKINLARTKLQVLFNYQNTIRTSATLSIVGLLFEMFNARST